MLLGCGTGVVNSVIAAFMPGWMMGYGFLNIILWVTSGILFVPSQLPEEVQYYLSYLPTTQITEWMRTAYYDGFNSPILDKGYVVYFSVFLLFVGLALERVFRGKILSS
jgi:capsular polysaccharide transport system permease protein